MITIETNSELDIAAEEFFQAAYKYYQTLKRQAPAQIGGVIWVRRGNEMVAYSHMGKYTQQVCEMTFDTAKDQLVFTEPVRGELGAVNGSASAVGAGEDFSYTTRTASLQMNGYKRAVLIEVGIRDEQRLQILLSKSLSAMAVVEWEVERMSAEDVSKYMEALSKQHAEVTPNAKLRDDDERAARGPEPET